MTPGDKAPPKGALEEAVSLFDELLTLVDQADEGEAYGSEHNAQLSDLRRRRAALEPRLAKWPGYKAKPRGGKS